MQLINSRVLRIGILSFMLGGTVSCSQLFNFSDRKQIAQIINIKIKQEQNLDRRVSLQGTVSKRVSFLKSGAYQLKDETGTIWIFTKNNLPDEGESLEIKGKLRHESIAIADRELGELYILETERTNKKDLDE